MRVLPSQLQTQLSVDSMLNGADCGGGGAISGLRQTPARDNVDAGTSFHPIHSVFFIRDIIILGLGLSLDFSRILPRSGPYFVP